MVGVAAGAGQGLGHISLGKVVTGRLGLPGAFEGKALEGDMWVKKSEVQQYRWLSVSRSLVDLGRSFASFS